MTLNAHHELDLAFMRKHNLYIEDGTAGEDEMSMLTKERLEKGSQLARALMEPIIDTYFARKKN